MASALDAARHAPPRVGELSASARSPTRRRQGLTASGPLAACCPAYNSAMSSRVVRRLASWIALVAIMALTFMPTIASALSERAASADICSADASRSRTPAQGQHTLAHCPYCALHAELALPPGPASAAAVTPPRFGAVPVAFLQGPRARGIWSTSQPRAPPVFA